MLTETAPLPPQNGVGSNDHKRLSPPGPDPGQRHPEKPISRAELRPGHRSLVDGELLEQGEVFEGEVAVAAAKKGQEAKQLEQEGDHRTRIFSGSEPADQPLPAGLNFGEGHPKMRAEIEADHIERPYAEWYPTFETECRPTSWLSQIARAFFPLFGTGVSGRCGRRRSCRASPT